MVRKRLEKSIEDATVQWAKSNGWLVRKLSWVGVNGAPDRIFFGYGVVIFIEFKAPGKTVMGQQKAELERIKKVYPLCYECDSSFKAIQILEGAMK